MPAGLNRVPVLRLRDGRGQRTDDTVAAEVPLEVRLDGRPYAVLMRTPGADRQLVAGFLLSERLIRSVEDLGAIGHCTDRHDTRRDGEADLETTVDTDVDADVDTDVVSVTLAPEARCRAEDLVGGRRDVMATAACGVCGRTTLASMHEGLDRLASDLRVERSMAASLPDRLRDSQPLFAETGGIHAAGLFCTSGTAVVAAEDVGRHNAVDKVTGALLLRDALPASTLVLCVSGRTSYEIVQKAWCAGVPIVVSVSAPSSLAVSLAEQAGITLAGFVRDGGLNVYTHAGRIGQD